MMKIICNEVAGLNKSYNGSSIFACLSWKTPYPFIVSVSEKQDHYEKVFHRQAYSKNRKHF